MKKDLETSEDIKLLVDTFYEKVGKDPLIGPIFHGVLQNNWQPHLEKMYGFWETILFEVRKYSGSPFPPHKHLPLEQDHFNRWLFLFAETLDSLFEGEKTKEALWRAEKMGEMFLYKIKYLRGEISPE